MKPQAGHFQFIQEAYRSLQKKRFQEAHILLENVITSRPDDPYPYFLLAVAYIFSDKFDRAHGIMDRVQRMDAKYLPLIQLQAFLYLKSATGYESALARYIELVEKYPADHKLHRALQSIRKTREFAQLQKHARLQDFVDIPAPPKHLRSRLSVRKVRPVIERKSGRRRPRRIMLWSVIPVVVAGAAALIYFTVPSLFSAGGKSNKTADLNAGTVDRIYIGEPGYSLINPISREKTPEFYYSNQDILADFDRAKLLIKQGENNRALTILNRINNSNARFTVKEKIEFLVKFIIDMEDRKYEAVPYDTLRQKLHLYRGYALEWSGKISNLKTTKNSQSFTLLVDYKKNDVFSGIAHVYSGEVDTGLSNGDMVRLRGVYVNTMGEDRRLYIVAREIAEIH